MDKDIAISVLSSLKTQIEIHEKTPEELMEMFSKDISENYAEKWKQLCCDALDFAIRRI